MNQTEIVWILLLFLMISDVMYGVPINVNVSNMLAFIFAVPMFLVENLAASATARNLPMFAISGLALYYLWDFVKKHINLEDATQIIIIFFFIIYFLH